MATSGLTDFNLDIEEIIEKAFQLVGGELTSAEDLKQARKSLDLLMIDLQNRGHPLGKLSHKTFTVASASTAYPLSASIVDVLDVVVTRSSVDTSLERIGLFEYHKVPNKASKGKPSQFALDRDTTVPTMHLYLAPDNSTDVIDFWCVERIENAGEYTNNVDISYRFLPALVFGLAYYMSLERTAFDPNTRQELKANYASTLEAAMQEDRERVSFKVTPPNYFRRR